MPRKASVLYAEHYAGGIPDVPAKSVINMVRCLDVATTGVGMAYETKANARLIAAAPEMLGILKRAAHILAEVPVSSTEQIERFDALRASVVDAIKQADPGHYGLPNHQGDEK